MTCLSVQPHNPLIFLPSLLYLSSPPLLPSGLLPWTQESLEWVTCASTLHCRKSPVTCSRAANTCGMSLKSESGGSRVCVCVCLCASVRVCACMGVISGGRSSACMSFYCATLPSSVPQLVPTPSTGVPGPVRGESSLPHTPTEACIHAVLARKLQ